MKFFIIACCVVDAFGKPIPGASVGKLTAQGQVYLTNGTFEVELNGLGAGTGYDQLVTDVAPILSDQCVLNVLLGFTPAVGNGFTIINNRSGSPVSGTFSGLPQDAYFAVGDVVFQITYTGGSGNDVVLTQIATPSAPTMGDITKLGNGQIQLTGTGVPGWVYSVEATENVDDPASWQTIGTATADGNGALQFVDPDAPNHSMRFYRFRSP